MTRQFGVRQRGLGRAGGVPGKLAVTGALTWYLVVRSAWHTVYARL